MNKISLLIAAAAATIGCGAAHADTVIHITGSTAFRSATVNSIKNLMGGAGNFKAAYGSTSGANETASNRLVIQGSVASVPAAGVVTIKCSWSGSTGGIKTVVQNIPVTTWPSITNLPGGNSIVGIADASMSYTLDTGTFGGENSLADITMEDSSQAATGFTTTSLTETRVGVIPFEWVAGNGSPATLNNITPLLVQAAISGGAPLSQFTGNAADINQIVYVAGRNFDSGTRLSCLTESGLSPFSGVQHILATISGTPGANGSLITHLRLYPSETVLGQSFPIGQSGYGSGGALADVLATPGASAAETVTGIPPAEQVLFGPGHLVAYLGRSDAVRAVKTDAIAGNTAHRLKYNGFQIWNDPVATNGTPASYNNNLIIEGLYAGWEYENLAYRQSYVGNGKAVADALSANIITTLPSSSGIKLSDMHCTKAVEGGVITSNQI